jgi:NAD(P)-dependent dehydrogenase (short-subunit alcohol dehydrogenase family)
VEDTPIADARDQFQTNFWGVVRVVGEALPAMRRQGTGRIVLMSSIGGAIGIPFQAYYSASKFALEGYGEALAHEVAPFGVHVTMVEPGNVRTEFTARRRSVEDADASGAYGGALRRAVGKMVEDEAAGVDPEVVARRVERILEARRPPRRVSVGKAGERVGILAKRVLPYRVFEAAAKGSLGV